MCAVVPRAASHTPGLPQASVLPTPSGPVAVLGPSVDELRRLLARARAALARGGYEPPPCAPCSLASGLQPQHWKQVLTAAEQLVNV